ncbi:MAG: hypothetical protein AB1480_18165 [Nitrospirota bacterium]
MQEAISLARHILDEHHKYYTKNAIDDTEMAQELKFILEGLKNYLIEKNATKKEIKEMLDGLKEYAKEKYMKVYMSNIDDEEGLTDKEKADEASYYFEYLFKHGRHPE